MLDERPRGLIASILRASHLCRPLLTHSGSMSHHCARGTVRNQPDHDATVITDGVSQLLQLAVILHIHFIPLHGGTRNAVGEQRRRLRSATLTALLQ
jgi:hypothetical protein